MFSRKISLLLAGNLLATLLAAQPFRSGDQFIQNDPYLESGGGEQNWGILQDQRGVIYVANNDKGILEFDGDSWRSIPVPNSPPVRSLVETGDKHETKDGIEMNLVAINLSRGDTLYMFSDGYIDQFGGKSRKKFGTQRLKALLAELQNNIMLDQKAVIKKTYKDWKGATEQIDDVLIVGIKV